MVPFVAALSEIESLFEQHSEKGLVPIELVWKELQTKLRMDDRSILDVLEQLRGSSRVIMISLPLHSHNSNYCFVRGLPYSHLRFVSKPVNGNGAFVPINTLSLCKTGGERYAGGASSKN